MATEELSWELYSCYSAIVLGLVLFAGAMSGLTIGLLSISDLELQMKIESGTPEEQVQAAKIAPVVADHHLVLVTLLLGNAVAMEALPLFLDEMLPALVAVLLSTVFVLIFGEIIPQAVLTGPNQLKLTSKMIPLVKFVQLLLLPFAWPLARLLDRFLGHKLQTRYNDKDLKALIALHVRNEIKSQIREEKGLFKSQVDIIHGAIDLQREMVGDYMTELCEVECIEEDAVLDNQLLNRLQAIGYSRLPVYSQNPQEIIGILHVKKLITVNPELKLRIKDVGIRLSQPLKVTTSDKLLQLLNVFSKGKHFALVQDEANANNTVGVITLEDVIERLLRKEILDENDLDRLANELSLKTLGEIHRRKTARRLSEYDSREPNLREIRSFTVYPQVMDGYVRLDN